jgi:hypothetical protein
VSDLPDEAIHFIEAVTEYFGAPEAVIFHNNCELESPKDKGGLRYTSVAEMARFFPQRDERTITWLR